MPKDEKGAILLVVPLVVILILCGVAFASYKNLIVLPFLNSKTPAPSDHVVQQDLPIATNTPEVSPAPLAEENKLLSLLKQGAQNDSVKAHISTQYLYFSNKDLMLGSVNSEQAYLLVKGESDWAEPNQITASPNGKYLTYLKLSDERINQFKKNPPIEYHGSTDYELYLVDITDPLSITTKKIYSNVEITLNQTQVVQWDRDSSGFSFYKLDKGITNEENPLIYYSIKDDKTSILSELTLVDDALVSLDGKKYLSVQTTADKLEDFIYKRTYKLLLGDFESKDNKVLVSLDTKDQKVMLNSGSTNISSNGYGYMQFLTNDLLVINYHNVISNDGNYTVDFRLLNYQGEMYPVDHKIFANNIDKGYSKFSISPNGKYLLAKVSLLVNQQDGKYYDGIFSYNIETKEKKYLGQSSHCLVDYYWLNNDDIYVKLNKFCSHNQSEDEDSFVLNLLTGEKRLDPRFQNKNIISLF